MNVARDFALKDVCLTEMEDGGALEWLNHNVDHNKAHAARSLGAVRTAACDWGWYDGARDESAPADAHQRRSIAALASTRWDAIIGSDLVYSDFGAAVLPRVLAALASPHTLVLYAHTLYRFEKLDRDFFDALSQHGLSFTEIWPPAAERSESPLPFSSVFAEERIAIFRIEKGGQSDEAARALRGNVQDAVPPGGPTSVE